MEDETDNRVILGISPDPREDKRQWQSRKK
jgi:hypothetical protein